MYVCAELGDSVNDYLKFLSDLSHNGSIVLDLVISERENTSVLLYTFDLSTDPERKENTHVV